MNSLSSECLKMSSLCLNFFKIFASFRIQGWHFFFSFFSTSEIFSIVLCMGSSKKSDVLIFVSTYIICAFFLWLFKIFSLSLVLSNLMMVQFSHVSCVWDSLNFLHLWVYKVH